MGACLVFERVFTSDFIKQLRTLAIYRGQFGHTLLEGVYIGVTQAC